MRKICIKTIGLLLAVVLCLSLMPMSAMATDDVPISNAAEPDADGSEGSMTSVEPIKTDAALEPQEQGEASTNNDAQPEYDSVGNTPFVQVVYHYYDVSQNESVSSFSDYAVTSTHSYYVLPVTNDAGMTIMTNKYPDKVPVSTDALRFRVLLNGNEDITAQSSYNVATGVVSLPGGFMDQDITVEWYCPETDIVDLPVKVTVGVFRNGHTEMTEQNLTLASNADTIDIPLSGVDRIVVSQNGLDLYTDEYAMNNDALTIKTPALGGDLIVSAFPINNIGGMSAMAANSTTVNHERQHFNSVNYGYVTSYYVANGNVAYCLDPSVSGVNSGTYDISGYMQRGTGNDNIIKAAWYLYRCPGEDTGLFAGLDWEHAYGYSHVAASYIYLETIGDDTGKAWEGIESNTTARNTIMGIVNAIKGKPMPPSGFSAYLYNVGNQTSQSLMGWEYDPTGNLEIQKVSSNTDMTSGNDCYSLEGAEFGVYNGSNEKIGAITTDKDGKGKLEDIAAGQTGMYILEEKPPKGYAEHTGKIAFDIVSGQTTTVEVKNKPQGDPVTILLKKQDSETSENVAQGGGTLENAHFEIKYYKGSYTESELKGKTPARKWIVKTDADGFAMLHPNSFVSGDPFYYASNGTTPTIPLGTVTVQEIKAPIGYLINDEIFIRYSQASGKMEAVNTYNEPIVKEPPIRGGVSVEKWDSELNRKAVPQGDATLAGAVFEIYNRNSKSVQVSGKACAPGTVVHTMTTDATGTAATANDLLPYGDYEVIEKTAPMGYLNAGVIKQTFKIKDNGVVVNLKTSATTIKNDVIRGGVEIEKYDVERDGSTLKQGDATLEGAVLDIYNRSASVVVVDGKEYKQGAVVYTLITDAKGWAGTAKNLLPYGSYEIIERTPPTGYLNTGVIKRAFEIRENNEIVSLKASGEPIKNDVIRGGLRAEKWDNEIDEHRPQGGATLEGAVFEIVNRSEDVVLVLDKLYAIGEVVYTFSTDSAGSALTPNDLLPYGTYEVRETEPPEGYLATGVLAHMFEIREHGKIVELDKSETAIKNDPIRGDLKGVKISDGDGKRMAGIPFSITSATTGESHTVITDKNGEFSTASSWNPHSQNTNRGETDRDGIWFGEIRTLDDDNGALLYDTYIVEELPCDANTDRELLSFEIDIYRHLAVVDLSTLTNDYIKKPEIFTTARDQETTTASAHVSGQTTILDTVYYSGLQNIGKEYTLKGVLMDKTTNDPLLIDGQEITAEKTFKALSEAGNVTMEYTFDSTALAGRSIVVFESLEYEGKEIAAHADIEDEGQTVTFHDPKIGTSATGSAGEKELDVLPESKIVDVVYYSGLIPKQPYTLHAVLMDKTTGEPLMIDGEAVTAEKTFYPEEESGTVEVSFIVDATLLKSKSVVVFESLEYGGREIAVHADIKDEGQTVTFKEPKIGTSAAGVDGEKELDIRKDVTLIDTVSYENLAVGKTYTLKAVLMDKETQKPLLIDGEEITAGATFEPDAPSGTVEVAFTFSSVTLIGKTAVVFESLEHEGKEIAVHADIEDEGQTVMFREPKIGTTAKAEDGSKTVPIAENVTVIDVVEYENLVIRESYILKGVLMEKESRQPLMKDGKEITAETKFVPTSPSESVEVRFVFDSRALSGETLVVFETLVYEGEEIAVHADINDAAQAIGIDVDVPADEPTPQESTPTPTQTQGGTGAKTGHDGLPVWLLIAALGTGAAAVLLIMRTKKRSAKHK